MARSLGARRRWKSGASVRIARAHDLDAAVVFLAAESSRYVTGQTLLVDGGISTGSLRALASRPAAATENKND